jgi:hypothetical protein
MTPTDPLVDEALEAVARALWQRLYNDPPLEWPGLTYPDAAYVVEDARAAITAMRAVSQEGEGERAHAVAWLRRVAKARDDRADPVWAEALFEAADYIEHGEHLQHSGLPDAPSTAADAQDDAEWCAPGDDQRDVWLVRFNDADMREALYTGPDAERDARAKWGMMCGPSGTWNGYLFRLAKRSRLSPVTSPDTILVEALREAETWCVMPCKDRLDHVTSWDICVEPEAGATGVAVIGSIYSGEAVANAILSAIKSAAR